MSNKKLWYRSFVAEKNAMQVWKPGTQKAHKPRNAVFLRAYVVACLLWVAVAGALGLLVFLFVPVFQPVICRPPRLEAGERFNRTKGEVRND